MIPRINRSGKGSVGWLLPEECAVNLSGSHWCFYWQFSLKIIFYNGSFSTLNGYLLQKTFVACSGFSRLSGVCVCVCVCVSRLCCYSPESRCLKSWKDCRKIMRVFRVNTDFTWRCSSKRTFTCRPLYRYYSTYDSCQVITLRI